MPLKDCCQKEAVASLRRHPDIATCDGCGNLLLAYEDEETFERTVQELESRDAAFTTGREDDLLVVSKER